MDLALCIQPFLLLVKAPSLVLLEFLDKGKWITFHFTLGLIIISVGQFLCFLFHLSCDTHPREAQSLSIPHMLLFFLMIILSDGPWSLCFLL